MKRDVPIDPSLRTAVEHYFALSPEECSVSISLEGTDDWSVQVAGPASVAAGRLPSDDKELEAINRCVGQMIHGIHGGRVST